MQGLRGQLLLVLVGLIVNIGLSKASPLKDQELQTILTANGLRDFAEFADHEDAKLTVPEIIVKYGYPCEIHNITTGDGYILQAHRIPFGKKCGPGGVKRVIWLQHGLLGDSSNWVINGVDKGLAYLLADNCYDVWMGNFRGNTYSKKHVTFDPVEDKELFWGFSWNEIGINDVPANIDYALKVSGASALYYVGHSMGTTTFWVCMSERPEYNDKILLMNALAPVSYTEHMRSPVALLAPFVGSLEWVLQMMGLYEFLPSTALMEFLGATICHENSPIQLVCTNILFLVAGYDMEQMDPGLLEVIMAHSPAGSSTRCVTHYAQGVNSGLFRKYDFGKTENMAIYGQEIPPEYDISKITAPVALYWGENDWLGVKADVYRLAEQLPNIQRHYRVNFDKFNHMDFLWAIDANPLLNEPIMTFMERF